jgi:hypothetical protein
MTRQWVRGEPNWFRIGALGLPMASHFDLSVIAIVGIMRVDVAFTLSATRGLAGTGDLSGFRETLPAESPISTYP